MAQKSWRLGLTKINTMPIRFTLNTSYACNLNCIMCQFNRHGPFLNKRGPQDISREIFEDFADQVFPTLIEAETTTTGEPFLDRHFKSIISKALEYGVKLYVTTNGSIFPDNIISDLIPVLSTLVISIDAVDPELYEKVRCGASFEHVKENTSKFMELRNNFSGMNKPEVTFQMTLMRSNIGELPKLVDFAAELGANTIKAYHAYIFDGALKSESLFFHKQLSNEMIKEAEKRAQKKKVKLNLPRKFTIGKESTTIFKSTDFSKPPCYFLWNESFLEPNGDISACFFPYRTPIGSICSHQFQEVWNNDNYQSLRKVVAEEPPKGFCNNCELRYTFSPKYHGSGIRESQFILFDDQRLKSFRLINS